MDTHSNYTTIFCVNEQQNIQTKIILLALLFPDVLGTLVARRLESNDRVDMEYCNDLRSTDTKDSNI